MQEIERPTQLIIIKLRWSTLSTLQQTTDIQHLYYYNDDCTSVRDGV